MRPDYNICYSDTIAGFKISLSQHKTTKRFKVEYGEQVQSNLSYSDAAKELGYHIMHALACESNLDNSAR